MIFWSFDKYDTDARMLADIRELLYILVVAEAEKAHYIEKLRVAFRDRRMQQVDDA